MMVWWLEENEEGKVERKEGFFGSQEEMTSFLSSRLETGKVVDWIGSVESFWYEVEGELPRVEETPDNGFYPPRITKTNRPASDGEPEEE